MSARDLMGNGEVVIVLDRNLRIVDACSLNSPRDHILSYRLEELTSLSWIDLIHHEDLELFLELLGQAPRVPGARVRGSIRLNAEQQATVRYTIDLGLLDYSSLSCQDMGLSEMPAADLYDDGYLLLIWMAPERASQRPICSLELEPGVFLSPRAEQNRDFTLLLLEKMGCHVLVITENYSIEYVNANTRGAVGDVLGQKCYQCIGLEAPCAGCRVQALFDHQEEIISFQASVCFHRFNVVASLLTYPGGTPAVLLVLTDLAAEHVPEDQAAQNGASENDALNSRHLGRASGCLLKQP